MDWRRNPFDHNRVCYGYGKWLIIKTLGLHWTSIALDWTSSGRMVFYFENYCKDKDSRLGHLSRPLWSASKLSPSFWPCYTVLYPEISPSRNSFHLVSEPPSLMLSKVAEHEWCLTVRTIIHSCWTKRKWLELQGKSVFTNTIFYLSSRRTES
jgi:hypothetical protein